MTIRRVLNQAYSELNRVLSLQGSQYVGKVETEHSVLTHDLNPIVQAKLARPIHYTDNIDVGDGAVVFSGRSLRSTSAWDEITRGDQRDAGAWDDDDEDLVITSLGFYQLTAAAFASVAALASHSMGAGGTKYRMLTDSLSDTYAGAVYAQNEPYYAAQGMPWRVKPYEDLVYRIVNGAGSGQLTMTVDVWGWVAPKGVLTTIG